MAITVHTKSNAVLLFPDADHIVKVSDAYLAIGTMGSSALQLGEVHGYVANDVFAYAIVDGKGSKRP